MYDIEITDRNRKNLSIRLLQTIISKTTKKEEKSKLQWRNVEQIG
jgi:hypothetical protein